LRNLVKLCGIRATGLKGLSEQETVDALEKLLEENGLSGKISQEKAKQFKHKNELKKELEELKVKVPLDLPRSARRARATPLLDTTQMVNTIKTSDDSGSEFDKSDDESVKGSSDGE